MKKTAVLSGLMALTLLLGGCSGLLRRLYLFCTVRKRAARLRRRSGLRTVLLPGLLRRLLYRTLCMPTFRFSKDAL